MATLYITEFPSSRKASPFSETVPVNVLDMPPVVPPVAEQTVAIGAASVASAAFNAVTTMVRVCADAACSVSIGANPTATATTMRLAPNVPEYFQVMSGQGHKIAAITNT